MRIRQLESHALSGAKRQHIPCVLYWECPECGEEREHDFSESYISYPKWGEATEEPLFCMECDELEPMKHVKVVPDLSLSIEE